MKKLFIGYAALTTLLLAVTFAVSAGLITQSVEKAEEAPVAGPVLKQTISTALAKTQTFDTVFNGQHMLFGYIAPLHLAGVSQRKPLEPVVEDYILLVLKRDVAPQFDLAGIQEHTDSSCVGFVSTNPPQNPVDALIQMLSGDEGAGVRYAKDLFIPMMECAAQNNEACMEDPDVQATWGEDAEWFCRRDDAAINIVFYTLFDPAERVAWRYYQNGDIAHFCDSGRGIEEFKECGIAQNGELGHVASARGLHDLENVVVYYQAQQFVVDEDEERPEEGQCSDVWTVCTDDGPIKDTCSQEEEPCTATRDGVKGRWVPLPLENAIVETHLKTVEGLGFVYVSDQGQTEMNGSNSSADMVGALNIDNDLENRGDSIMATTRVDLSNPGEDVVQVFLEGNSASDLANLQGRINHEAEGDWLTTSSFEIKEWPITTLEESVLGDPASKKYAISTHINHPLFIQNPNIQHTVEFRPITSEVFTGAKLFHYSDTGSTTRDQEITYHQKVYDQDTQTGKIVFSVPSNWGFNPSFIHKPRSDVWWQLSGGAIDLNLLEIRIDDGEWSDAYLE